MIFFRPTLRSKIKFKTTNDIHSSLVGELNFDSAYIHHQSTANFIVMLANNKLPAGSTHKARVMKEKIRKFNILLAAIS